ncbi:uncharacterized protein LOC125188129 [Salvia hispanica]|uniref:uncharacterized protein LOC125188129 n=1 Tax=Salvia hispanica TaxID=49212 RepID=UPI002008F9E9|nr:uncharacterized protein LOC125188129 [Salvia hispanica]
MSNVSDRDLSLKYLTNKEKTKVLFAEANIDFVNVLLSFLTLPLGKIVKILNHYEAADEIGSLNGLYKGLSDLDISHFSVPGRKDMLLDPRSSFRAECSKLKIDITYCYPEEYFVCQDEKCKLLVSNNISLYSDVAKCGCGKPLNREIEDENSSDDCLECGPFVVNPLDSFIISDDLCVAPVTTGIIQTLNDLGIAYAQGGEFMTLNLGTDEIMDLLKFSLTSTTPLTDVILKRTSAKRQPEISFTGNWKVDAHSRKIPLKLCVQKSTNKCLFAQATDEFVELLFSFLTVPLGGVEYLLGGKIGIKNIDNLYSSISTGIHDEYFTSSDVKNRLINPKLPHGYIVINHFLPLSEEGPLKLYLKFEDDDDGEFFSLFKASKKNYVKKQTICFITDDLKMSTSVATGISIINRLGIPMEDVKEMEFDIGLHEALCILKASLTSKMTFTEALIKPLLYNANPSKEDESSSNVSFGSIFAMPIP